MPYDVDEYGNITAGLDAPMPAISVTTPTQTTQPTQSTDSGDKPDFTSPPQTPAQIEKEYRDAIDFNDKIQSGEVNPGDDFDYEGQKASVQNIQNKLAAIETATAVEKSYEDAGKEVPAEVKKTLTELKAQALSPFATIEKKDGQFQTRFDTRTALVAGIGESALEKMGISREAITGAKQNIQEQKEYRNAVTEQNKALTSLSDYKSGTGYNIEQAIRDGKLNEVKRAGFTTSDIEDAQKKLGTTLPLPKADNKGFAEIATAPAYDTRVSMRAADPYPTGLLRFGNPKALLGPQGPISEKIIQLTPGGRWAYTSGVNPILRQNINAPFAGPLVSVQAQKEAGYPVTGKDFAIAGGMTVLSIAPFFLKGASPKIPTVKYAPGTSMEEIAVGRATGVPVEGFKQIRTLEGNLVSQPISIVGDTRFASGIARSDIGKLPTLYTRENPAYLLRGESGQPIIVRGVSSTESFGQKLNVIYEADSGGVYRPSYYIGSKKLDIPTKPNWNPGSFSDVTETGFYSPKPTGGSGGGSSSVVAESSRMTPEQIARFREPSTIPNTNYTSTVKMGGLLVPRYSSYPETRTISTEEISESNRPSEAPAISPIVTPSITNTPNPVIINTPEIVKFPTPIPISTSEGTFPEEEPTPVGSQSPDLINNPPTPYSPPSTYTPPEEYIPPVEKVPTPVVPIAPIPIGSFGAGWGGKHGKKSHYFLRMFEIPEMYVALPEGLQMKPSKLGKPLWKKFLAHPAGVEQIEDIDDFVGVPGQEISVKTPFGIKKNVKVISKRVKLKSGASEQNLSRMYRGRELPGTTLGSSL